MPKRKSIAEVRDIISRDSEYEIIEPLIYRNSRESTIHMRHIACGNDFFISLDHWQAGQRPHRCAYRRTTIRKTTQDFIEEVKRCDNSEDYDVIGEYVNKRTKIEMRHISKNHNFFISPEDFLDGCRCGKCFGKHLKTTDDFIKEIEKITSDYEIVGEYTTALSKIKMKHLTCGTVFETRPNDFLNGHGCPKCKESRNEKKIEKILIANNVEFEKQKTFSDCRYKSVLRFDFYLPKYNTCIEFDGEFHFMNCIPGVDTLEIQKQRDKAKNEYCMKNGIKLIRISYLEKEKVNDLMHLLS